MRNRNTSREERAGEEEENGRELMFFVPVIDSKESKHASCSAPGLGDSVQPGGLVIYPVDSWNPTPQTNDSAFNTFNILKEIAE